MKAQLVKREDRWDLYNEDGHKIASTLDGAGNKLSFKNCQAIERGYDLDELAYSSFPNGTYETSEIDLGLDMYKLGFQKALEILGDKKFSEEDINNAMNWIMTQYFEFYEQPTAGRREHYIQSLQQTEWGCIVEMEGFVDEEGIYCGEKPKLDADGCIVLKRK